jgi:Protein of unknown function (DUF2946)
VLRMRKADICLRPWIAVVSAYALALQLLLSGVLASQLVAADNVSPGTQFYICHGSDGGPDGEQDGTGKPPGHQTPCVLCVLANGSPAILPSGHASATLPAKTGSDVVPRNDERIVQFHSPTGQYPRGPPARARAVG